MLVIPAIDLKDGQCVRLRQGRMEDSTVFSDDPVQTATHWKEQGARRLHLVDLNGAFAGEPVNGGIVKEIAAAHPDLPLQIGGGIRDLATIESYLNAGVQYVIIGTQAVKHPPFVAEACKAFPGHIIVGLDAKDGWVATHGWAEVSDVNVVDLAQQFADDGVDSIIYTDIARDGMMQGVNIEATVRLASSSSIPVIASGGVSRMEDIVELLKVADTETGGGIMGAITGRAIYEGALDLAAAQAYCDRY
ncbi:1-(5-phosphoribosyl)-5-[(5-phosphoribosylamino)methylideneamino]imidazole-4-carboxamide isomerase [Pseudohongiella spirulinae]|uniref:1-(5-phosphoribosyl)-5-[(5-phosphoribosylamino)methylideneamino] imidazole-4-carboxamide isomerase n=1 Tax=Pseudohongiella spirulinae TaxID=1249552 RepID=A0A0S2KAD6_9GAMM|nr:1-(5-phosphoribosyl)-5-[(5-phosphoribosylamino)methylideneamino]imidazole-4-carboxamide isomerase [Pseudohongiella spirulinae]ALO45145.1 1-(5-phosphoribosyl)-5-[(5-phosphoribosylamino)methylideneamino] imidazole-4-carboxamide isomerase [Pseudohongiella spirulinae]